VRGAIVCDGWERNQGTRSMRWTCHANVNDRPLKLICDTATGCTVPWRWLAAPMQGQGMATTTL